MKKKELEQIKAEITKIEQQNGELLLDLQRTRADFENFRKNVEEDRKRVSQNAKQAMALSMLNVIDDVDRATANLPTDLKDHPWASGIVNLNKKMANDLKKVGLTKIEAQVGDEFNPELHEAVMVEESDGETEVIAEVLRTGYLFENEVLRHVSVKVKHQ